MTGLLIVGAAIGYLFGGLYGAAVGVVVIFILELICSEIYR